MALNENIKSRRMQLKMSQEYVADQLGISRQAVAKWESGQSRPTSSNLTELAALFEMDVSELVDPQKWVEDKKEEKLSKKIHKEMQRCMLAESFLTSQSMPDGTDLLPVYIRPFLYIGLQF